MKTVLLHLAGAKSSRILQNSHLTAKFHYSKAATGVGFLTILKKANFLLYEQNYRFFLFVFFSLFLLNSSGCRYNNFIHE